VALTWDEDDPERNRVTRRTLTRKEIEEADFKAYLASSTSGSETEADNQPAGGKRKKRTASRDKLRALLLGGGNEDLPEGWGRENQKGDDVDMEITFTPGLSEAKGDQDETTLEKYQRKMREKRKKRKEGKGKAAEQGGKDAGAEDDFFDVESGDDSKNNPEGQSRKEKKRKATKDGDPSPNAIAKSPATPKELELLIAADNPNAEPKHFNMKSILKAEKSLKRKGKKGKKAVENDNEIQEDFAINVEDERFKALHENHTFAIDPSNPQ
jgi:hypothetical protein